MGDKEKKLQELKKTFDNRVVQVYDGKLKGNYFIHQSEPNSKGRGIDYNTGGRELAIKGGHNSTRSSTLFRKFFKVV